LGELANSDEGAALERSVQIGTFQRLLAGARQWLQGVVAYVQLRPQLTMALASVAMVAALVFTLIPEPIQAQQHMTGTAETRLLTLEDGSQVTLGAKSTLKTWSTDTGRHVELVNGQAFFDVAKDPSRPFWVNVNGTLVKVVGTQFDVRKGADRVQVAVVEGVVNVFATTPEQELAAIEETIPVVLTAGKLVEKTRYGHFEAVKEASVTDMGAWRNGRLVYRQTALADVVADANRYYEGTITLGTQALAELEVTAAFRTNQVASLPEMLSQTLPIVAHREPGNRIVILPRP